MRQATIVFLLAITPMLCGAGEVYQSKDAEGNTVFSDMPSAGAQVIKVAPTNSADPVQDIPALAAPDKSAAKAPPATNLTTSPSTTEHDDDTHYWASGGGNDLDGRDDGVQDREKRRDTPISERPRVNPLPSGARPAKGGGGRR